MIDDFEVLDKTWCYLSISSKRGEITVPIFPDETGESHTGHVSLSKKRLHLKRCYNKLPGSGTAKAGDAYDKNAIQWCELADGRGWITSDVKVNTSAGFMQDRGLTNKAFQWSNIEKEDRKASGVGRAVLLSVLAPYESKFWWMKVRGQGRG